MAPDLFDDQRAPGVSRRRVLQFLTAAGIGNAVFGRALAALAAEGPKVTSAMIDQAAWISGIELTEEERELMLEGINDLASDYETNRQVPIANSVAPALLFHSCQRRGILVQECYRRGRPRAPLEKIYPQQPVPPSIAD